MSNKEKNEESYKKVLKKIESDVEDLKRWDVKYGPLIIAMSKFQREQIETIQIKLDDIHAVFVNLDKILRDIYDGFKEIDKFVNQMNDNIKKTNEIVKNIWETEKLIVNGINKLSENVNIKLDVLKASPRRNPTMPRLWQRRERSAEGRK